METKFYYIHGLPGSKKSNKFLELQKQFANIECLEWTVNDAIDKKVDEWKQIIISNNSNNSCVIASSTGANFAVQLRKKISPDFIHLVLINPLLNVDYLVDKSIMPVQLKSYLVKFDQIKESLILISALDSIINNMKFLEEHDVIKRSNQIIVDLEASHQFETLHHYYKDINLLVNSIYL